MQNANLFNFTLLLVDFGKVLCPSVNELQQNSNASSGEEYIPQILTVLLWIHHVYIWPLWPFVFCLSFLNNSYVSTPSSNKSFWPDSRQILRHQYGISVAESQTFLLAKRPQRRGARRNGCFRSYVASIYANLFHKRKRLHKKRVQLPQDWFGTLTWPPVSWRHVKTLNYFFMPYKINPHITSQPLAYSRLSLRQTILRNGRFRLRKMSVKRAFKVALDSMNSVARKRPVLSHILLVVPLRVKHLRKQFS